MKEQHFQYAVLYTILAGMETALQYPTTVYTKRELSTLITIQNGLAINSSIFHLKNECSSLSD